MSEFQRNPSRVWWSEEYPNLSRNISASPGSQDSGFSDTENCQPGVLEQADPNFSTPRRVSPRQCLPKDILKNINEEDSSKSQNLTINFKPKCTPTKSIALTLSDKISKSCNFLRTPTVNNLYNGKRKVETEPIKKSRFHRNGSLKVSRSLFNNISKQSLENMPGSDQYSDEDHVATELHNSNTNSKVVHNDSRSDEYSIELEGVKTCPTITFNDASLNISSRQNSSAPAFLPFEEERRTLSSTKDDFLESSDCESELESAFHGLLDHPKHTSTPKVSAHNFRNMKLHRSKRISKLDGPSEEERNSVLTFNEETASVQKWLKEVADLYEPECMTTLQCKSIAAELIQNVAIIASRMTSTLRQLLRDSDLIYAEIDNIKQQTQHTAPLAQSLTRLIEEFIQSYAPDADVDILKICNDIRNNHIENFSELINQLDTKWKTLQNKVLLREIKPLVNELVDPHSEMHVRAALTGITSIALRNKVANDTFISCNTIQILCVLCEKCESSTVRSLILRALSTICTSSTAVRHLENASGVTILSEVIFEESRPEPERSEAVALLAQITAPWIEDNECVKGLQYHIKTLVKALTQFITNTKCCQNLLLGTAALANLTEMEPKSVKYILYHNSIGTILQAIKTRNALVSIHVLEQVAILIATLSSQANARKQLTDEHAPGALLHFLHCNHADPEIESRLQQKSVIALSRLSSEPEAAEQIVKLNGVAKLVKLCRDRKERHGSDAVLVAALATLRKIAEACGNDVIDSLDVQELIEPRLMDSFLAYSAQNESYV